MWSSVGEYLMDEIHKMNSTLKIYSSLQCLDVCMEILADDTGIFREKYIVTTDITMNKLTDPKMN